MKATIKTYRLRAQTSEVTDSNFKKKSIIVMKNQLSLAPGSDIYWPEAIRPVVKSQTEIYFVFITWII